MRTHTYTAPGGHEFTKTVKLATHMGDTLNVIAPLVTELDPVGRGFVREIWRHVSSQGAEVTCVVSAVSPDGESLWEGEKHTEEFQEIAFNAVELNSAEGLEKLILEFYGYVHAIHTDEREFGAEDLVDDQYITMRLVFEVTPR